MFLYPGTGVLILNIFVLNTITIHTGIFLSGLSTLLFAAKKPHMLINKTSLKITFFPPQIPNHSSLSLTHVTVFVSVLSGMWKAQTREKDH